MPRSTRYAVRPFAAIAALTLALSSFALAPASAEPTDAPEREVSDGTWGSSTPTAMRLTEFPADTADLERDEPQLSPAAAPTVSGVLEYRLPNNSTAPVVDGVIRFWREVSTDVYANLASVGSFGPNGEFSTSLTAGTYRIEFITFDVGAGARTYWNNEPVFFGADKIVLNEDFNQNLGTVVIEPLSVSFDRVAGLDRFETAAALSAGVLDGTSPAPVVYIVNAFGFADALSAGPAAAAQGGVLLPVYDTSIPDVIRDELTRLNPERIVIAGGTGVVSAGVETELQAFVDSPADVDRVAGPDRYATSRAIVLDAFGDTELITLFFATGRDFPDALAAGPAAAFFDTAVLLVDGSASSLPPATRALIEGFDDPYAFLAGGTGVISSAVAAAIAAEVGGPGFTQRLAGADRFETSRVINEYVFRNSAAYSDFAFIANAYDFPDALSAGPVAAAFQAPLYLSAQQCLDARTASGIADLLVSQAFLVGGTGVLSDRVLAADVC
ncbi:cell wall-binding repeat-containing protein [Microcella sp.]|uniref:cell wall-binding repeat-containing protein n=1 Tax=Microcella sp. TaxID=1913979 RepID=UPI00255E5EBC|nr:cell wall-binding repeat-containing protein [Microcella sp.]MBX9472753.1 cell wall-binding repeat-containing protein [Microcella sp.]